ncbi:unnamed protein product [Durusdinium trenchii]|uniref:glucose-6-phosphate 1-epimerase n=2 Tax=Durusdinium trenchii TaxID=1381693 RepID=A0ABP0M427_9DINO
MAAFVLAPGPRPAHHVPTHYAQVPKATPSPATAPSTCALRAALVGSLVATAASARAPKKLKTRSARASRVVRHASTKLDDSGAWSFVHLKNGDSEAKVYLRGANVTSFKVGGVEWIGLRADCKLDGSKANISGGLPICFPQFGPGEVIPQHGFARNMDWTFVEGESSDGKCVLELVDSEETKKVWPFEFRCTYTVELTDGELATTMKVENLSESECTFTTGIHSYFATSDIDKLGIVGKFKGCTYEDRTKNPPTPVDYDKDEIKIAEFRDEIYKKVWPSTVTLQDPEKGDLDIISDGGWRDLVVWNPYGDDKMGYKTFVCVESVECDPISLAAGSSWEATVNVVPRK